MANVDRLVKPKHSYFNLAIIPFSFYLKERKILTIKNKELEKIIYVHFDNLNLLNFSDRVVCPL